MDTKPVTKFVKQTDEQRTQNHRDSVHRNYIKNRDKILARHQKYRDAKRKICKIEIDSDTD